jgi:hypothetical protein
MGRHDDVHLPGKVLGAEPARIVEDLEGHAGVLCCDRQLVVAVGRNHGDVIAALAEKPQHLSPEPTGADERDFHASSRRARSPVTAGAPFCPQAARLERVAMPLG